MVLDFAIISFLLSSNVIGADSCRGSLTGDGLSYDDLKQLNVSCHPKDTCEGKVPDHSPGINDPNSCSCHPECSALGTCCIDSPHRGASPSNQKCSTVNFPETHFKSSGYYTVQSCPEGAAWKHLCEGGLDKDGDVLRIAPVTSLDTNTTYKNYYCFRCNEMTDNFARWNLELLSGFNSPRSKTGDFKVTYNGVDNTWSATAVDEDVSFTVRLRFTVSPEVTFPVIECNPKVVTGCPDSWEDDAIRSKCDSYAGLLYKSFGLVYRNAHCALCHSERLDELSCVAPKYPFVQKAFSFSHLIDINRSDGDEVGKKRKCPEGEMWDPYGKKCRELSCALPGYVIKDGKCVAP